MAAALIGGLTGGDGQYRIVVHEPDAARATALAERFAVHLVPDNSTVVADSDVVVLAVKPQVARDVTVAIAPTFSAQQPLLISIAAGIRAASLADWLGGDAAVVRAMPNTPALVGQGISALYATPHVQTSQRDAAERVLGGVGEVLWVTSDAEIDMVTAVSGSGPAYFFLVMEAMTNAGKQLGLPEATARRLAVATAVGAGALAQQSNDTPRELREAVTSPGGTTQRALQVLQDGGLVGLFDAAISAACRRAAEMADEFGASASAD